MKAIKKLPLKLNQQGFSHAIVTLVVVMALVGSIGIYVSGASHAATPSGGTITGVGGMCLSVEGTAANDSELDIADCSGAAQWAVTSGTVQTAGNLCLVDKGGSTTSETHARIETCTTSPDQKWQFANGTIISTSSGLCLEDRDGRTTAGNTVWLNTCSTATSQQWTIASGSSSGGGGSNSSPICSTAPTVPTNFHASVSASQSAISLSWSASTPGTNCALSTYGIYRDGTAIASTPGTSYTDTDVSAGKTYSYTITATDTAGHISTSSAAVSVSVPSSTGGGSGSPPGSSGSTVAVSTAAQLATALSTAKAGETIELANGTYGGNFVTTASGTATDPITLEGSAQAILAGPKLTSNYALHLSEANYWHIQGISLTGAQKGIVLDNSSHDIIDQVQVYGVGDEGIHLRQGSSYDTVEDNYVHNTGLATAKFGEGIYVGSAIKNWSLYATTTDQYGNQVDGSDYDSVINNTVANTGAENIDMKEGTYNNTVSGNTLSNPGQGAAAIDIKGNNYIVSNNTISGATTDHGAVEVWELVTGYGQDNLLSDNSLGSTGPAVGIYISSGATGNTVSCSNTVVSPSAGLSNQVCAKQ